jgi:hypothetical protein
MLVENALLVRPAKGHNVRFQRNDPQGKEALRFPE